MSLADSFNLRTEIATMSDIANFVDSFETKTDYTPTYTVNAGVISQVALNYAHYYRIGGIGAAGPFIFVRGSMRINLTAAAAFPTVSVPFTANGFDAFISGSIAAGATSNYEPVTAAITAGTSTLTMVRSGAATFASGNWEFRYSGLYTRA